MSFVMELVMELVMRFANSERSRARVESVMV
jgi:hypothetical protein